MKDDFCDEQLKTLYRAILLLETEEECKMFMEDLCTISELKAMKQRLQVAQMLSDRQIYTDVAEQTGASTATISRVNRSLRYGSGGYQTILERIHEK